MSGIHLIPCTRALWHDFHRRYVPDPMMDDTPYDYEAHRAEARWLEKSQDPTRLYFSICVGQSLVGQIYLKHMDSAHGTATVGIALSDDSVKGRGFGTEAILLLAAYARDRLGLRCLEADAVLRNTRSQHVLEKCGFVYAREDDTFMYYRLELG